MWSTGRRGDELRTVKVPCCGADGGYKCRRRRRKLSFGLFSSARWSLHYTPASAVVPLNISINFGLHTGACCMYSSLSLGDRGRIPLLALGLSARCLCPPPACRPPAAAHSGRSTIGVSGACLRPHTLLSICQPKPRSKILILLSYMHFCQKGGKCIIWFICWSFSSQLLSFPDNRRQSRRACHSGTSWPLVAQTTWQPHIFDFRKLV